MSNWSIITIKKINKYIFILKRITKINKENEKRT